MTHPNPRTALESIVHAMMRPQYPGTGLSERDAWNLMGELGNQLGEYIGDRMDDPELHLDEALGMRRGAVLFHQMVLEARPATEGS